MHKTCNSKFQNILIFIFIILAIAIPRMIELDRFVTIDEPRWMARSANFYNAIRSGELFNTYQAKHPGVTTMWAGAAGYDWQYPEYSEIQPDQLEGLKSVEPILRRYGKPPIDVLEGGRIIEVLFITILLGISFYYAARLMGLWPAVFGMLLIAFDPFHIAHSRVLQLDGLQSSAMLLSLLALLVYLFREKRVGDMVVSGVAVAIAGLTRSPGLFMVPYSALMLSIEYLKDFGFSTKAFIREWIRPLLFWGLAAGVVFILLWPAMWIHPKFTLLEIFGEAINAASGGHDAPTFFNGRIFDGDPGILFYPVSYLWRSTPVVLIGISLSIWGLLWPKSYIRQHKHRGWLLGLILFVVLYTAFMTLSAKKFDRYLLPIFAPLDLLAAMGWVSAIYALMGSSRVDRIKSNRKLISPAGITVGSVFILVIVQLIGTASTSPYYLSYYNPLMGGGGKAPEVMMIGWGEGLDEAARYLNEKENASDLRVKTWYSSGPFDYFFKGKSETLHSYEHDLDAILDHDYVLIYVHQWQREIPSREILNFFRSAIPEHVISINGIDYVSIYSTSNLRVVDD